MRRIQEYDGGHNGLNAMTVIAPLLAAGRGSLSGTTIALKDNIDVRGLPTTAGSHALAGAMPRRTAPVVDRVRAAGAILVGKTAQLELSGWVTFDAPSGYSQLGGRALNPHDPRLTTGGSSSGAAVAVAAEYVDAAIGTDTGGSVLNPAGLNGLFGLRPTIGSVPVAGIVPVASQQDTPGPMARSVRTLAAVHGAMIDDETDGLRDLEIGRLDGALVGVPLLDRVSEQQLAHFRERLVALRLRGAVLVPILDDIRWRGHGDLTVPAYGFREAIDGYLDGVDAPSGVHDFSSLLEHYRADLPVRAPYGAANLLRSAAIDLDRDAAHRDRVWAREQQEARGTLDELRDRRGIQAVLFPDGGAAYLSSKSGYPALTIPGGVRGGTHMNFTTVLATAPGTEQLLLEIAFEIEQTIGGAPRACMADPSHP